jgi:hypothetical protein
MNTMRDRLAFGLFIVFVVTILADLIVSALGAFENIDVSAFRGEAQRLLIAELQLVLLSIGYYFGRRESSSNDRADDRLKIAEPDERVIIGKPKTIATLRSKV